MEGALMLANSYNLLQVVELLVRSNEIHLRHSKAQETMGRKLQLV